LGLCAYGSIQVFTRMFYAMQDTWTPVVLGMVSIAANIALSVILLGPMKHAGLALAYSLAGMLNMLMLFYLLRRKAGPLGGRRILRSFLKTLLAAFCMGLAAWALSGFMEIHMNMESKVHQLVQVTVSAGLGIVIFFALARLLNMEESRIVADTLLRRIKKQ
jgi:putative peptidoglycan lipid II flippase